MFDGQVFLAFLRLGESHRSYQYYLLLIVKFQFLHVVCHLIAQYIPLLTTNPPQVSTTEM